MNQQLYNCLSNKQKEILNLILDKDYCSLINNYSWNLISLSLPTFKCLGLFNYKGQINYPEQLKEVLGLDK